MKHLKVNNINPWKNYYRHWEVQQNGKKYIIRSYGLCYWTKIVFLWKKNGRTFYRVVRNTDNFHIHDDSKIKRKEYSFKDIFSPTLLWSFSIDSDTGERVILPNVYKDHPIINYMELANHE